MEKFEHALSNFDIICFPYDGSESKVRTDACEYGEGESSSQLGAEAFLRPVSYRSSQFNLEELKYSVHQK